MKAGIKAGCQMRNHVEVPYEFLDLSQLLRVRATKPARRVEKPWRNAGQRELLKLRVTFKFHASIWLSGAKTEK